MTRNTSPDSSLRKTYPAPSALFLEFNPGIQTQLVSLDLATLSDDLNGIPTLAAVRNTYGEQAAVRWLSIQFSSVNKYAEQGQGMTDAQTEELCKLVLAEYYWLNLCEIAYFIAHLKLGRYGEFYGAVGPMKIAVALRRFTEDRKNALDRLARERHASQLQQQLAQRKSEAMSYEEYQRSKQQSQS